MLIVETIRGLVSMVTVAPYWNVNFVADKLLQYRFEVTVAPYWNVN